MKEAMNFIRNLNIKSDESIVVAVSGGPDSMALLDLLIKICNEAKYNIVCAHVNHNVREESKDELEFVKEYCEDNNVIFESLVVDKWQNDNFHALARKVRYEFFESLLEKYNSKYLFLAHHGDDLIETILMRLTRGSSFAGYHAFLEIESRETYSIIRPLLNLSKQEIEDYDKSNNINYVIDKSNFKDKYTRNRYRKYVLPFLKQENSNVIEKFKEFSETIYDYEEYIMKEVLDRYDKIVINNIIELDNLKECDKLIQIKILEKWLFCSLKDNIKYISKNHINEIFKIITSTKPNIILNFPNKIYIIKNYNKLMISHNFFTNTSYDYILDGDVLLPNGYKITTVENSSKNSNYVCYLNSEEISLPIHVRTRIPGDTMEVKGMIGKKKVKSIFIDEKISMFERNLWPIVTDNNGQILWIPGIKKSKLDKNKEKYDIILRYQKEETDETKAN